MKVVRIALTKEQVEDCGDLVDCLGKAGIVEVHGDPNLTSALLFDLLPPERITDTETWAKTNADRLCSLGFGAVPAPKWG